MIALGLLQYLKKIKESGHHRLFPELKVSEKVGKLGRQVSKQFSGVIKTTLVDLEKKLFYSLRHTFANFFKQRGLQNDFFRYLFGHTLPHLAIQPGKPQQNSYIERSNRTVCYD